MPGKFDQMVGAAAYIESFLDQDKAERELSLREFESKVAVTGRIADIQSRQGVERRAQAIFPSQLEQAGLRTQTMEQQVETGALSLQDVQERREQVKEVFGRSLPVIEALRDAGKAELAGSLANLLLEMDYPGREAETEKLKMENLRTQLETFKRAEGPEAVGRAAAAKPQLETAQAQYEQTLIAERERVGLAPILVDTERELALIAPQAKLSDMLSNLATAKARLGALANTPAGKEQALREAWPTMGLPYSFDEYLVRQALRKSGEWQDPEKLFGNVQETIALRTRILSGEMDQDAMQLAVTAFISKDNPELAVAMQGQTPDKAGILKGLTETILVNKNLLMEQGLDYVKLAARERRFTVPDVERVMGAMMGHPDKEGGFFGFSTAEISTDIKEYLVNIVNKRDPSEWERVHQALKAEKVRRWSQNDWMSALDLLRWIRWEMGKAPGSLPPKAAHLDRDKEVSLPWPQPRTPDAGTENIEQDLNRLLKEIDAELDLDALERQLQGARQ